MCPEALPGASATYLGMHGGRDEAEPRTATRGSERLATDDIQPPQMQAEGRMSGRRAFA
jgi:hypothetical protein